MIDIKFTINGLKTGNDSLDFSAENEISKFYRKLVDRLNALNIKRPQNVKEKYPNIDFPEAVEVKILMIDNNKIFQEYFDDESAKKTLGLFNLTNSKQILGKTNMPDEFIVLIEADINNFNRLYNQYASYLDITKEELLSRYLVTLTHEICHAVEFIENSGGLTPFKVEELFEADLFGHDVDSCATGHGHLKYAKDYVGVDREDDDAVTDIMEDRVESKGIILYQKLNITTADLSDVLSRSSTKSTAKIKSKSKFKT